MPVSGWLQRRSRFDRLVAAIAIAAAAPVVVVLAIRVRVHDRGRAFVRLERVGAGGHTFGLWKLRTMRPVGPSALAGGEPLTAGTDERVTAVGVWLRRSHLDELPQLVNVLRAEMLLLGPRPEAPDFVDVADARWRHVLAVSPGMAGPTQLLTADWERSLLRSGTSAETYRSVVLPVKLAIDEWYVERASPRIDGLVVVALFERLLLGRRRTVLHRRLDLPAIVGEEAAAVLQA